MNETSGSIQRLGTQQVEGGGARALIQRALDGDRAAMQEVWEQNRRWVAAVLLAHKPHEAELEDLLQEVAQALVGKLDQVRDAGAFTPWLRSVAISIARTKGRRATVRRTAWKKITGYFVPVRTDIEPGVEEDDEPVTRGRTLLDLAAELGEGYREPLLMKCVRGMSYRQIGAAMGLPETTVETRIARARRMLRERAVAAGLDGLSEDDDGVLVSAAAAREGMRGER